MTHDTNSAQSQGPCQLGLSLDTRTPRTYFSPMCCCARETISAPCAVPPGCTVPIAIFPPVLRVASIPFTSSGRNEVKPLNGFMSRDFWMTECTDDQQLCQGSLTRSGAITAINTANWSG